MNELQAKISSLLEEIKTSNLFDEEVKERIATLFPDSYVIEDSSYSQYFQESTTTTYLKKSDGLYFKSVSGLGDILGNMHARSGDDISLHSAFQERDYPLYIDGELQSTELQNIIDDLNDTSLVITETEILNFFDNHSDIALIGTLSSESLQNDKAFITKVARSQWEIDKAGYGHGEKTFFSYDDDLSETPSAPERFSERLSKFPQDSLIVKIGQNIMLHDPQGRSYIEDLIRHCEREIFYVDNKNVYDKIDEHTNDEMEVDFQEHNIQRNKEEVDSNKKTLDNVKQDLANAKQELTNLKIKSNTVLGRLTGHYKGQLKDCLSSIDELETKHMYAQDNLEDSEMRYANAQKNLKDFKSNSFESIDVLENSLPEPKYTFNHPRYSRFEYIESYQEAMEYYEKNYEDNKIQLERYNLLMKEADAISLSENQDIALDTSAIKATLNCYSTDLSGLKDNIMELNKVVQEKFNTTGKVPDISLSLKVNNHEVISNQILNKDVMNKQLRAGKIDILESLKDSIDDSVTETQLDYLEQQLSEPAMDFSDVVPITI